jgi:hypothetical protein
MQVVMTPIIHPLLNLTGRVHFELLKQKSIPVITRGDADQSARPDSTGMNQQQLLNQARSRIGGFSSANIARQHDPRESLLSYSTVSCLNCVMMPGPELLNDRKDALNSRMRNHSLELEISQRTPVSTILHSGKERIHPSQPRRLSLLTMVTLLPVQS